MSSTTIAGLGGVSGASNDEKSVCDSGCPLIHSATVIMISVRTVSGTPWPMIKLSKRDNNEQLRTILLEGVETFVGSLGETRERITRR